MLNPAYHEPLPDFSPHWICVNRIADQMLGRMCSGHDAVCDLDEALRRGVRGQIRMGCERKQVTTPEWSTAFQLICRDMPEGDWLIEIIMRETGALLVATCYIWLPDWERFQSTETQLVIASCHSEQPEPTPEPEEPVQDRGGREPEHNWEAAAQAVDNVIKKDKRPLPRKANGTPNYTRAVEIMMDYFDNNEPSTPEDTSVRRWLRNHKERIRLWWGAKK